MEINFFQVITFFTAFAGVLLAGYIFRKKKRKERLVCPIGFECDRVVWSEYSTFFGIPLEIWGLVYYAIVAATYGVFLISPPLASPPLVLAVFLISVFAFLFSLYLIFVQALALKEWCTWCLASAGLCTVIFVSALTGSGYGFRELLGQSREFLLGLHILGMSLGLGGATITDILFFRFLKDFRVSEKENEVFRILSQVLWFGLFLAILSGAGLFVPDAERFLASPKFLAKMIVVAVIVINGAILNVLIAPRLVKICFGGQHNHEAGELHHLRHIAYALGAISIVSWYSAFILGFLSAIPLSFLSLIGVYVLLIGVGIFISQLIDRLVGGK